MKSTTYYWSYMVMAVVSLTFFASVQAAQEPDKTMEEYNKRVQELEARIKDHEKAIATAQAEHRNLREKAIKKCDAIKLSGHRTYTTMRGMEVDLVDEEMHNRELFESECKCKALDDELWKLRKNLKEACECPPNPQKCAFCHTPGYYLKRCTGCKTTYYCSASCQEKDWPKHQSTEWQCPICLNYDDLPRLTLTCGHQFHEKCIKQWLDRNMRSCPTCRGQVQERTCSHCGIKGFDFKRCSNCKTTYYCSANCQRADWAEHKARCLKPSR